jgi:N-acetylmuramoyl-L-alanine amidase
VRWKTRSSGSWPATDPVRRAAGVAAAMLAVGLTASGCAAFGAGPASSSVRHDSPKAALGRGSWIAKEPKVNPGPRVVPRPLAGKIVGIDPGHNGLNGTDPAFINRLIWNGRQWEHCNTTGTATNAGYPEALFNWHVATYLAAYLRADGARVVLTRHNNHGVGPCVNWRSYVLNRAHADVSIDIHADGGPSWGRGFTVLEPAADKYNGNVIGSSLRFGRYVHAALLARTPFRASDYYGHNGYIVRDDLAGLNLTTQPKVLIECGNMRNSADAALLTSPRVQQEIARALEAAIVRFLTGHWGPLRP